MHTPLHSVPPTLQPATTHPHLHWILTGKSGSVSCGSLLLSPGSWCTRFCLCPPRIYFPVLCKFWQFCGGINGDLLQESLCHTQVCCTQIPSPCGSQSTADLYLHRRHSNTVLSVSVGPLGPGVYKVCLSPLSVSGRNGV